MKNFSKIVVNILGIFIWLLPLLIIYSVKINPNSFETSYAMLFCVIISFIVLDISLLSLVIFFFIKEGGLKHIWIYILFLIWWISFYILAIMQISPGNVFMLLRITGSYISFPVIYTLFIWKERLMK